MPGVEQSILTKLLDKYSQELLDTTVKVSRKEMKILLATDGSSPLAVAMRAPCSVEIVR